MKTNEMLTAMVLGLLSPVWAFSQEPELKVETTPVQVNVPVQVIKSITVNVPRVYLEQVVRTEVPIQGTQSAVSPWSEVVVQSNAPIQYRIVKQAVSAPATTTRVSRYRPRVDVRGMTIAWHLKNAPHNIDSAYVDSLSLDNQWRLHDQLHGYGSGPQPTAATSGDQAIVTDSMVGFKFLSPTIIREHSSDQGSSSSGRQGIFQRIRSRRGNR